MENGQHKKKKNRQEKNEKIESNHRQQIAEFSDETSDVKNMQSKLGTPL